RPRVSFEQWYSQHYSNEPLPKEQVRTVLLLLGRLLHVEPTRLYPTDRLGEELSIRHWWVLDETHTLLEESFKDLVNDKEFHLLGGTVDDVIRQVVNYDLSSITLSDLTKGGGRLPDVKS